MSNKLETECILNIDNEEWINQSKNIAILIQRLKRKATMGMAQYDE